MAKWLSEEEIYVGDTYGNAVPLRVGVVKVGRRITVGFQRKDADDEQPAYTLDPLALQDMMKVLAEQRSELFRRSGGL